MSAGPLRACPKRRTSRRTQGRQGSRVYAAAAALRNWAINLHKELADTGIQAAHVGIDVSIGRSVIPGFPTAEPEEISPVYWGLHTTHRDEAEGVFSL